MFYWILNFFSPRNFGALRSAKWPEVMKAHLKEEPLCAVCKSKGKLLNALNVHHCLPFHLHPDLELDDTNLITLCRIHHFWFGHLGNWASFNKDVRIDCLNFWNKIKSRP